jgi:hypothetical protein
MERKSDHYHVGMDHAAAGLPRYKFQDQHLQKEYDKGYDAYQRLLDCERSGIQRESPLDSWRRIRGRQ